jgi:small subunit ribosomal protein S5
MTAKENRPISDVKIPATGVDVAALLPDASVEITPETLEASEAVAAAEPAVPNKVTPGRKMRGDPARRGGRSAGPQGRGGQRGAPRERIKPEFDSKIIDIRRVTRVTSGGRRMNFSVAVVAGDHKGRVGVGLGKGGDTAGAVEKATREAKKNLIKVPLSPQMTIQHAVEGKHGSAYIKLFPARGSGVVAGSSARAVIELAGIKDIAAKFLSGSKNRLNNARATINALENLSKESRNTLRGRKPKEVKE